MQTCTNFLRVFGVSEDFEALFSARLRKFFGMNLILMYVKCSLLDFLFTF